ncbi:MAG: DUF2852 domain-containing protein [Alphaproteobacteria bacterium]|jgi:DNA modification methylase|nr:DUF2852 domain-containing protein [Alphaproteobacteria bacterium]
MSTSTTNIDYTAPYVRDVRPGNWFTRAEAWLDDKGKGAWIAAMVLGFIFVWPVGLAILAYMIWSKRMFSGNCAAKRTRHSYRAATKSSGNTAFDAYKQDTLRRLEDEQQQFEDFLQRLREAKDKAEFDQFMEDRAKRRDDDGDDSENAA